MTRRLLATLLPLVIDRTIGGLRRSTGSGCRVAENCRKSARSRICCHLASESLAG
jgi:hypothetical protein